ncbi:MAG TPA: site-2 protease family protein, partial [Actinomycetota bacterium]|nr:site-2 protease family protein [Actinomycetota bacterium]
ALIVAGFGWGRPVPFSPMHLHNRRWGAALVGLAGPAANFVVALASVITLRLLLSSTPLDGFEVDFRVRLLEMLVLLNVVLGVFNLLPIPPLDGSRLLSIFLPPSRQNIVYFLDQYGIFLLLGILILAPGLLTPVFRGITRFLYSLVGLI